MVAPDYYLPSNQKIQIQEMPFCFVVESVSDQGKIIMPQIVDSIKKQNYKNYTLLNVVSLSVD